MKGLQYLYIDRLEAIDTTTRKQMITGCANDILRCSFIPPELDNTKLDNSLSDVLSTKYENSTVSIQIGKTHTIWRHLKIGSVVTKHLWTKRVFNQATYTISMRQASGLVLRIHWRELLQICHLPFGGGLEHSWQSRASTARCAGSSTHTSGSESARCKTTRW